MNTTIAIDGPAGCGKSTVAKRLAKILGIVYLDTGAMYRAVAYWATKNNIDINEVNPSLLDMLKGITMDIKYIDEIPNVFVSGENVTSHLRTKEVAIGASLVAKIPQVRKKLVELQQDFAKSNSVVMDGRDIGTKVLPFSKYKYFLTASIEERSKRRYFQEKGSGITLEEIQKDIMERDNNDIARALSPLVKADDAMEIDTSNISVNEVVAIILKQVKNNGV